MYLMSDLTMYGLAIVLAIVVNLLLYVYQVSYKKRCIPPTANITLFMLLLAGSISVSKTLQILLRISENISAMFLYIAYSGGILIMCSGIFCLIPPLRRNFIGIPIYWWLGLIFMGIDISYANINISGNTLSSDISITK